MAGLPTLDQPLSAFDAKRAERADPVAQEHGLYQRVAAHDTGFQSRKVRLDVSKLNAAAVSQTLSLLKLSDTNRARVLDVFFDLDIEFAGGGASLCDFEVGQDETPDPDAYVTSTTVFTAAGTGAKVGNKGADLVLTSTVLLAAGQAVTGTITSDVNVDLLTDGSLDVTVIYQLLP